MPRPPTITRHILGCLILKPARQDVFVSATDYQINFTFVYHSYDLLRSRPVDKERVFDSAV